MFWADSIAVAHRGAATPDRQIVLVVAVYVAVASVSVVVHEAGHALAVLAVGQRVLEIRLGHGPTAALLSFRGSQFTVGARPFGGGYTRWTGTRVGYRRRLIVVVAGPFTHLAVAGAALAARTSLPYTVWPAVVGVSMSLFLGNLIPGTWRSGQPTDGKQLMWLLRERPPATTDVRNDAQRLIDRAGEGDPQPLLRYVDEGSAKFADGTPEAAALRDLRGYALAVCGRFLDSYRVHGTTGDSAHARRRADACVSAMLFGQLPMDNAELSSAADVLEAALATAADCERLGMAHGLTVARLVQNRPDDALALLATPGEIAERAGRVAVCATRGITLARTGDTAEARRVLTDLMGTATNSPWVALLAQEVGSEEIAYEDPDDDSSGDARVAAVN